MSRSCMTGHLRRLMLDRPYDERVRLWLAFRRLNKLEHRLDNSFSGGAGFKLSDHIQGGRLSRLQNEINKTTAAIGKITRPVLEGYENANYKHS